MRRHLSLRVAIGLCALLIGLRAANPPRNVLTWDVFGYYLYLPATFIHHDPALKDRAWIDAVMERYAPSATLYQLTPAPNGNTVVKYSAGMAIAYTPFFLVAHAVAKLGGWPADGFSPPYQHTVAWGCMLYVLFGILLFRALLLRFFTDRLSALVLVLVVAGTNFLHLVAWDGTLLTHPLLFTLYCALILLTIGWHRDPTLLHAAAIGTCAGAIVLIRPSEAVCVLIPLLWGLHGGTERARTLGLWRGNAGHFVLAAFAFLIALLPQALYWKLVAGQWLFYSYANNPGEGFEFGSPWITDYLFSFRKGWFVYTPLMAVAVAGIALLWGHLKAAAPAVTFAVLAGLWVAASWSTWWYAGGSFSARSMVPLYPLLALPLGLVVRWGLERRGTRVATAAVLVALLLLNLFQTWQWTRGILSKERMTGAYYKAVFGRTAVPPGADTLLLVERSLTADEHFGHPERYDARILHDEYYAGRPEGMLLLTEADPFSPGVDLPFSALTDRDHAWVRATALLWVDSLTAPPPLLVMAFHHQGAAYKYRARTWELTPGDRGWAVLTMDYLTPEVRSPDDNLKVYLWNRHGGTHAIGRLKVEVFEPKRRGAR